MSLSHFSDGKTEVQTSERLTKRGHAASEALSPDRPILKPEPTAAPLWRLPPAEGRSQRPGLSVGQLSQLTLYHVSGSV